MWRWGWVAFLGVGVLLAACGGDGGIDEQTDGRISALEGMLADLQEGAIDEDRIAALEAENARLQERLDTADRQVQETARSVQAILTQIEGTAVEATERIAQIEADVDSTAAQLRGLAQLDQRIADLEAGASPPATSAIVVAISPGSRLRFPVGDPRNTRLDGTVINEFCAEYSVAGATREVCLIYYFRSDGIALDSTDEQLAKAARECHRSTRIGESLPECWSTGPALQSS